MESHNVSSSVSSFTAHHVFKVHLCVCESCSVTFDSLRPHGLYSPWNSPGQNTGVGSLSLLQGIYPTQGLNPGLPHCRWILYQLSHEGSPRFVYVVANVTMIWNSHKVLLYCSKCQNLISFYAWILFCWMDGSCFVCPLVHRCTFRLFPSFRLWTELSSKLFWVHPLGNCHLGTALKKTNVLRLQCSWPKVKPKHSGRWKHMPGPHLQILWLGRFGWAWKPSFSVRSHPSLSQLLVQMIKPLFCKKLKKRKSSMFELWVHFFPIF